MAFVYVFGILDFIHLDAINYGERKINSQCMYVILRCERNIYIHIIHDTSQIDLVVLYVW